jgi:dethiobiotin synthetase
MFKNSVYLVLAIGTNIGKTHFVCLALKKNKKIKAIKPLISGFVKQDENSDTAKIINAMGLENNLKNIKKISPWRFKKPLSPNFAGKVDYNSLLEFCQNAIDNAKKDNVKLLIEGAGGVLSPITNNETFLDLASDLKLPIILITSNYLGALSHTISAIESILNRHLKLKFVILNDDCCGPISDKNFINCLKKFTQNQVCNFKIISIKNFIKKS